MTGVAVGFGGDGAGVYDDDISIVRRFALNGMRVDEFLVYRSALGLGSAAAEIGYVKSLHDVENISDLSPLLRERVAARSAPGEGSRNDILAFEPSPGRVSPLAVAARPLPEGEG